VTEKPFTMLAPNVLPKKNRIKQVISVEVFESRIEGQARLQARSSPDAGYARAQFFLQAFKNQHVCVHCHADAQDKSCDAGQG